MPPDRPKLAPAIIGFTREAFEPLPDYDPNHQEERVCAAKRALLPKPKSGKQKRLARRRSRHARRLSRQRA